jgi:hypothetical protein
MSTSAFTATTRGCGRLTGDTQESRRRERPVHVEPEERRREVSPAVHVRIGRGRRAAEAVEEVIEVERTQRGAADQVEDHQQVAEEIVVHHGLEDERQRCDQEEGNDLDHEALRVEERLEVPVALRELIPHEAQHPHGDEHGRRRPQREQLREGRGPVRHRHRVHEAVDLQAALAPDELARVEREHDDEEERIPGADRQQHQVGDRPDRRPEHQLHVPHVR